MKLDPDCLAAIAAEVCAATGARLERPWALAAVAGAADGFIGLDRVGNPTHAAEAILLLRPLTGYNELLANIVRRVAEK